LKDVADELGADIPKLQKNFDATSFYNIKYLREMLFPSSKVELDFQLGEPDKFNNMGMVCLQKAYECAN